MLLKEKITLNFDEINTVYCILNKELEEKIKKIEKSNDEEINHIKYKQIKEIREILNKLEDKKYND